MTRRLVGGVIVAVWLGVLGLHVQREYFKGELLLLEEGARSLAPGALFYTIRMNERAIGLATSSVDTLVDGFRFSDLTQLDVPATGQLHRATANLRADLSPSLSMRGFEFSLDSELGRFDVSGRVEGDSLLRLRIGAGGDAELNEVRLDGPLVVPATLPLRLAAAGRLEVGAEYRARIFDPSVLATRELIVRVLGRDTLIVPDSADLDARGQWRAAGWDTVPTWRVSETVGGIETRSWLDEDGRMIRSESALGFTIERTEYELAASAWRASAELDPDAGYGELIESTAIASNAPLTDAAYRDSLRVRLGGVELEGFDLGGGRQTLRGDTLLVRVEPPRALRAGYRLPYDGSEHADALESTPLIQAEDPRIVRQARAIVGDTDDPAVAARRLNDWVYDALEKDVTLSLPSAVQVLEGRRGDCNEHTVLYVALARAVGLPTRTAVGLVSVNGRFYYHAWPEVWLGGWTAVDPTLGQFPADATHLRFLIGDLVRQLELVRLIGRLRLDVVEPQQGTGTGTGAGTGPVAGLRAPPAGAS